MILLRSILFLILAAIWEGYNAKLLDKLSRETDLDLLDALNISSGSVRGVNRVKSLSAEPPVWRFNPTFDNVQLPQSAVVKLLSNLRDNTISVHFVFRQHRKTIATLFSINSPGKTSPWLRLTSNHKHNTVSLFYHVHEDTRLQQYDFAMPRMANWTNLAVTVRGNRASLFVNCQPEETHKLSGQIYLSFPMDSLIYFRQEPGYKRKFLGCMQVAKISSAPFNSRPWKCL